MVSRVFGIRKRLVELHRSEAFGYVAGVVAGQVAAISKLVFQDLHFGAHSLLDQVFQGLLVHAVEQFKVDAQLLVDVHCIKSGCF